MKTLNIQELLRRYKIDVDLFDIEDTFDVEDMAYKRKEILDKFDSLTQRQKKEFLDIDKKFMEYIPKIKEKYPRLYDLVIKSVNEDLKEKNLIITLKQ